MTKEKLEELKQDLDFIKAKFKEKSKVKPKKEKETLESVIQYFTNNLVEKYKLTQYNFVIKTESHKTKFFIQDVEDIIREIENKDTNPN
tara:strand:- start:1088 stop:1354 length:267 start_codon:yes stop_codon:yes gene_type:complete